MRLWSLHPSQLDRVGLVACWREGLLAQKVLVGATRGYRNHPQLQRFRDARDPRLAIATYLHALADEADARGYNFARARINLPADQSLRLTVTTGQLAYEWDHLRAKLAVRAPGSPALDRACTPRPHPLFHVAPGPVATWEKMPNEPAANRTDVSAAGADGAAAQDGAVHNRPPNVRGHG